MTDDTAALHKISSATAAQHGSPRTLTYVAPVWCSCGWRADSDAVRATEWMPRGLQVGAVRTTYGEYAAQLLAAVLHLDVVYNIVDAEVVDDELADDELDAVYQCLTAQYRPWGRSTRLLQCLLVSGHQGGHQFPDSSS